MKHKWKEKCDCCGKWTDDYSTGYDLDGNGYLICNECSAETLLMQRMENKKDKKQHD